MKASSLPLIQFRLAQLAAHLVVALIALVVVGGATRVMEAGLACPDWPLCFGSLLPGRQMNVQVFLEWFHRLDAFLVGIALCFQLGLALIWRAQLPRWIPLVYGILVSLVVLQGALGALTVMHLLPSAVVTAHLVLALTLVAVMSGVTQRLLSPNSLTAPIWWRLMAGGSLLAVLVQCVLGGRMATTWAAQRCLSQGEGCGSLALHRGFAMPVAVCVLIFVITAFLVGGWARTQWPLLLAVSGLVATQIILGLLTVMIGLQQPFLTVGHQLVAALLVAFLAALICRGPFNSSSTTPVIPDNPLFEPCHG